MPSVLGRFATPSIYFGVAKRRCTVYLEPTFLKIALPLAFWNRRRRYLVSKYTSVYICWRRVFAHAKTSLLLCTTDIPVRSETTRREHKLTAGTVKNVHPCIFFTYVFAGQTRYWLEPPPSVASSKIDLLVNFWTRVFAHAKTSLLHRTTAVRGGMQWNRAGKMCRRDKISI